MSIRDPRVDTYIAKSADFARPILEHLRGVVHAACPDVEETLKWSSPHFMHKGLLCGMAAFKRHVAFGFWLGERVTGGDGSGENEAMGQFGRLTKIADLPPEKTLTAYVKKAAALNDAGVKSPTRGKDAKPKPALAMPADLAAALAGNRKACTSFEAFSPSHRREYVEWITEAKRAETRAKRLATTLEWLSEGKPRNWKYTRS